MLLVKFKISGHSMEPALKNGDFVLLSSFIYIFKNPSVDDIVAFRKESGKVFIKRITKIENGKYYVQGDNKKDSLDSKNFGFINRHQILGKIILKI